MRIKSGGRGIDQIRDGLGEKDHDKQYDDLQHHKGNCAFVNRNGRHLFGRNTLQIEKRKTDGRRNERGLQIDRHHHTKPNEVHAQLARGGHENRHCYKRDLGEFERDSEKKNYNIGDDEISDCAAGNVDEPTRDQRRAAQSIKHE